MTKSTVIFLGPLPGSSKTMPFCEEYSVKTRKAKESNVLAFIGQHRGPGPPRSPHSGRHCPLVAAHITQGELEVERTVQVSRLIATPASSELQLHLNSLASFSPRTHLSFPIERNDLMTAIQSLSESADSPHHQEKTSMEIRESRLFFSSKALKAGILLSAIRTRTCELPCRAAVWGYLVATTPLPTSQLGSLSFSSHRHPHPVRSNTYTSW